MFGYLTGLVKKHACQWRWISLQTIVPLQVENLFETALFLSVLVKNFLKGEQEEGAGRFLLRILYSVKFCWHLGQLPYSPDIPLYYWQITQHIGVANSPVSEKHISVAANDPSVFTINHGSQRRCFQPGEFPSWGHFCDCKTNGSFAGLHICLAATSSMITAIRVITVCSTTANK